MEFKNFNLILSIFLILVIIGFSAYNNEEHFFTYVHQYKDNNKGEKAHSASDCKICPKGLIQSWTSDNKYCSCEKEIGNEEITKIFKGNDTMPEGVQLSSPPSQQPPIIPPPPIPPSQQQLLQQPPSEQLPPPPPLPPKPPSQQIIITDKTLFTR